jgi:ABC-2 type transport system permease protein
MPLFSPRLKAQIVKEFLSLLRDSKTRVILIAPPMIQLFLFAFAVTLEVHQIDIAVLNHDDGHWSQELIARVASTDLVKQVVAVNSEQELKALVEDQKVIAALDIPQHFSRDVAAGRPAVAQLVVDGRRANAGQITQAYLSSIAATLDAEIRGAPPAGAVAVRHWFNPNLIYRWFVVPGLAGTLTTFIALLVTALSIARERELGTFDQLLVSPCTPTEIIVAKTMPGLAVGLFLGSLMTGAGVFLFGIPFQGSLPMLAVALVIFVLSIVGVGLMISAVCATQQQAILGTFSIAVPMILVSGFATPVANMPIALQWLAEAMPLKHFLIVLQGSFTKALPVHDVLANTWPMAVIAAITLTGATILVRSKLQ